MRATVTKCFLILVLLALPVTDAMAQPPTPEPTATPIPQVIGSRTVGSFALGDLVDFATLVGIIIVGFLSAYVARVLRPMQRREVELLERKAELLECQVATEKQGKESLASLLGEEKTLLEMQLREAKEKANIPRDITLPSQPVSLDPKDRETLQRILNRLERIESVSIAAGVEAPRPDPWKYIADGNLQFNLQQYEQAIQEYNKALELKPDFPEALYNRGFAYRHLDQYERAIQDYDRALELNPDDHEILNGRGLAYFHLGQYERAIQDYDKALQLKPDYPDALYNRAIAYRHLGQYERAIQDYDKALQFKPDDPDTLYNRGLAYFHLGQYERAIQDYDKALELNPDNHEILNGRGIAYRHLGQYERAIKDLNTALEVMPDFPGTRYNMACVYSLMNKPDEALKWLREAIDLDEEYREMAKSDSDFDNIRHDPRFKELVSE